MSKKRINREINVADGNVKFTVLETGKELVCAVAELSDEMKTHLILHGLNAKVGDAAADKNKGDPHELMAGVFEELKKGNWSTRTGGGGGASTTILHEAVAAVADGDLTVEQVKEKLESMSDEELAAVKANDRVKAEMAAIRAKRQAEKAKKAKKDAADSDGLSL